MDEVEALKRENHELRARLEAIDRDRQRERERHLWVLKRGGSLLVPLVDRMKVVRNFVALFRVCTGFAGPREGWPKREDVQAAAEAFAVSLMRFFIRRRLFLVFFSIAGLAMPVLQVWFVVEQNRLVDLQNQLIEIQADDIIARGVTTSDPVANQLNGALLSGRDFEDLSGMLRRVFGTQMGEYFGGGVEEAEERAQHLKNTAGRTHLLLALAEAIKEPRSRGGTRPGPAEMWRILNDPRRGGALPAVLADAAGGRARVLLRSPKTAFGGTLEMECGRYMLGLSLVLRHAHSLAVTLERKPEFFRVAAPLFASLSHVDGRDGPLVREFTRTFREVLLDFALEPSYGAPEPTPPRDVEAAIGQGFARLQQGVGDGAGVKWASLKALLEVK